MTVELFGVPRVVVGRREVVLECDGDRIGDVAGALGRAQPELRGRVLGEDGWLLAGYTFVVAERFTRDRDLAVAAGASVLLVAASAGG